MADFRHMLQVDLDQVNLLLSKSFTVARSKEEGKATRIPLCRKPFLEMYLTANPAGAFVAEASNGIVAFCFSRIWGSVAWLGPLGVLPSEQGKGLGKQIVTTAVESLKACGVNTIGLEVAAQSSYNLAFYSGLGFVPQQPTVDMIRYTGTEGEPLPQSIRVLRYGSLSPDRQTDFLAGTIRLSRDLEPGLDYRDEIRLATKSRFGDALLFLKGETAVAFVLAHTENYSSEEERQFLKVNVVQIAPGHESELLPVVLSAIERFARQESLPRLYLRVPTRYAAAFTFTLATGFKVVRNELRMTLDGFHQKDNPEHINVSKWE